LHRWGWTKVLWGTEFDKTENTGIDLVAMCVNDLITCGGEPFSFGLFASGKLDLHQAQSLLKEFSQVLSRANATLIGGETAEMPGVYRTRIMIVQAFVSAWSTKTRLLMVPPFRPVSAVGISSSGFHSNGYSF